MKTYNEIKRLFERANTSFLLQDRSLFECNVSERTLCGALMLHIHDLIKNDEQYRGYYVDVEYNRNKGGIKTICKTIRGQEEQIIKINCDLILHSRGNCLLQDNLLAVEMKKSTGHPEDKQKDKNRLIALTKDSYDDVWAWDGYNLPEHVCRYVLGVYYEVNYKTKSIEIEYYHRGRMVERYTKTY